MPQLHDQDGFDLDYLSVLDQTNLFISRTGRQSFRAQIHK